ncbi:MAG TPA: diffusible signal factor-reguated Ax21 family protein [Pseudoxanthomonas sp.]|nr:diffusible signal factor-reguated Ax21 family protein [Pseudoxanthomonas sp.]
MKKSLLALSLLSTLTLSAAASAAEGISYNYVEGGYTATNLDGQSDSDGWGLNGSVAIAPNFHVFGGYNQQDFDSVNYGYDQWRLGVGYNHEISQNVDLVTRVAYEKFQGDDFNVGGVGFAGTDLDGYSGEVGVRGSLTQHLEGYAMAGYEDGSDYDGDFYGRLGAQVKFNPNWGISGDVKFADNDTQWFVGPRFTW